MTLAINSVPEVLTFDYLRTLAGVEGVCLSAAFCIPDPAQAAAYLNSHLNSMQHALENNFSVTNIVIAEQILPYLKEGQLPRCPAGGTYSFGSLTNPPTCSIPGHAISFQN